jgi:hypothetical protein
MLWYNWNDEFLLYREVRAMKMIKKKGIVLLAALLVVAVFAGCSSKPQKGSDGKPDAQTSASIVNDETAFIKAIGEDGTWIVCTLKDLKVDQDLVIEGEFHERDDEAQDLTRKIVLCNEDDKHKPTDRFKLTVPKLTVKSPNTEIIGGTIVGDVYVESGDFELDEGARIEGNLYFANKEYQDSADLEDDSVSGDVKIQE